MVQPRNGAAPNLSLRLKSDYSMTIDFGSKALEELYTNGETKDASYRRLPRDIIKRYVKVVNYLRSLRRIEDLYLIKSLHYEKKKGDLKGVEVVWINNQYRLHFHSSPNDAGIVVNVLLIEITKHYE